MPTFASREDFKPASGIAVQQEDLKRWEAVLKPEVAKELREWAESTNDHCRSGYDVRRGDNLTEFICNYPLLMEGRKQCPST